MQYRLRVLDSAGALATVSLDARDEADARTQARAKSLKVLSADRTGGANAWSGISVDEERGLVFLPTGSAPATASVANSLPKPLW